MGCPGPEDAPDMVSPPENGVAGIMWAGAAAGGEMKFRCLEIVGL